VNKIDRFVTVVLITVTVLDIIHCPVLYLKHVSETGFCVHLQGQTEYVPPEDGDNTVPKHCVLNNRQDDG
jgi:hypothetical protein